MLNFRYKNIQRCTLLSWSVELELDYLKHSGLFPEPAMALISLLLCVHRPAQRKDCDSRVAFSGPNQAGGADHATGQTVPHFLMLIFILFPLYMLVQHIWLSNSLHAACGFKNLPRLTHWLRLMQTNQGRTSSLSEKNCSTLNDHQGLAWNTIQRPLSLMLKCTTLQRWTNIVQKMLLVFVDFPSMATVQGGLFMCRIRPQI